MKLVMAILLLAAGLSGCAESPPPAVDSVPQGTAFAPVWSQDADHPQVLYIQSPLDGPMPGEFLLEFQVYQPSTQQLLSDVEVRFADLAPSYYCEGEPQCPIPTWRSAWQSYSFDNHTGRAVHNLGPGNWTLIIWTEGAHGTAQFNVPFTVACPDAWSPCPTLQEICPPAFPTQCEEASMAFDYANYTGPELSRAELYPKTWLTCDWQEFAPTAPSGNWLTRRPLNIAHQGGENEVPSATMYGLKTSLVKGADMLEIDVHVTADGELVVLHDTTVDRTTNGNGAVQDLTLAEIKALDAAFYFVPGTPANHTAPDEAYLFRSMRDGYGTLPPGCNPDDFAIPSLREVLTEFPDVLMNIEIKNGAPQGDAFEATLANLLAEFGRGNDTVVAAFQDQWTEQFKMYNSEVDTAPGTAQAAAFKASTPGPAPGSPGRHAVLQVPVEFEGIEVIDQDGDFVRDAHANGWGVHVWTINDPQEMHWLLDIGVDGIMTAEPAVLEAVLQERGITW